MEVIPVLDLKNGAVVRARRGERDAYAPIRTPLSPTSDPVDVARGYLALYPFRRLYIADLDGIEGRGRADREIARLKAGFPHLELWIDNGLNEADGCRRWMEQGLGRLVLGSESQRDPNLPREIDAVLSLDFRSDAFQGPGVLIETPSLWPDEVILMTLDRIGAGLGPDFVRLEAIRKRAPSARIYAAGGVRHAGDLDALARAGARGALVASALHDGTIKPGDVKGETRC